MKLDADAFVELIRAIQDRSASYQWPPSAQALAAGRAPRLTRRGKRLFYLFRQQYRSPLDMRAVEVELVAHGELFGHAADETRGLTLKRFAELCGVDRGALSRHVTEIPTGAAPSLAGGNIPIRRIGNTRRVFPRDVFGNPDARGAHHVDTTQEATGLPDEGDWRRPLDKLREP